MLAWLPAQSAPAAKAFQLSAAQAPLLASALNADAEDMHYSAVISLLDAINGINSAYFSWAIVKLYYCCFYSIRSLMASNGIGIVYVPINATAAAPFSVNTQISMSPRQEKGVTHKITWTLFERIFPNNPLLGDIGLERAYAWMTKLRESVNYKNPRFPDPVVPSHFNELDRRGVQVALNAYIADTAFAYAFDADHAALAFPIECLKRSMASLVGVGVVFDQADHDHVDACLASAGITGLISSQLLA
ncbi:hypothetical protein [Methylobacterium oryzae]|uniref:hypothetical protein n=1 Tax=Methylobacterium oryzae TaxID=334852 RepID=UPI002F34FFE1